MFLILLSGILLIVLIPRLGPILTLVALASAGSGLFALSAYLYINDKLLIDMTFPGAVTIALYALLTFANYSKEAAEKKQVRGAFGQYLSPALVEQLAEDPDRL